LQHDQLMSERGILCFKSALGLEERGSQVKDEEYQRDHRGPARRRACIEQVRAQLHVSERRACAALGQTRKYIVVQSASLHRSEPPYVRASASLARFALQL
jgi:hypothetical protein